MTWLAIRSFLGGIPWQVWAGIAVIMAPPVAYCTGYNAGERDGREAVKAMLQKQMAQTMRNSWQARAQSDKKRAAEIEQEQEILRGQIEAIEKAEADDANALDSLF